MLENVGTLGKYFAASSGHLKSLQAMEDVSPSAKEQSAPPFLAGFETSKARVVVPLSHDLVHFAQDAHEPTQSKGASLSVVGAGVSGSLVDAYPVLASVASPLESWRDVLAAPENVDSLCAGAVLNATVTGTLVTARRLVVARGAVVRSSVAVLAPDVKELDVRGSSVVAGKACVLASAAVTELLASGNVVCANVTGTVVGTGGVVVATVRNVVPAVSSGAVVAGEAMV